METRTDRIRRLQGLIAAEEALKAIFEKRGIYGSARQVLLDNLKSQLDYEKQLELEEISRPAVIQSPKRSWQDNIGYFIGVGVIIAVIAGLLIALILT
jgi:hypothetical protein